MNIIDFSKIGGYRLKQATFEKMQSAYLQILKAFVAFCNVPENGNYIISGCNIIGANIQPGYLYMDGELCYFSGSAGTIATKIKKQINITSLNFKNGIDENVFRQTSAIVDNAGSALSTFTTIAPVFDGNYIHTDNNFSAALLLKLNNIQAGAEVNVQTNWNENNPSSDAYLLGKPDGQLMTYLHKSIYVIGDVITGSETITVNIPNVGTDNYSVLGDMVSFGSNDQHVFWKTREHNNTYFKLQVRDIENAGGQNLKFYFFIVPN